MNISFNSLILSLKKNLYSIPFKFSGKISGITSLILAINSIKVFISFE